MNNICNSRTKGENKENNEKLREKLNLSVILNVLLNIDYRFNCPNFKTIRDQLFKAKLKAQSKTRCVIFVSI